MVTTMEVLGGRYVLEELLGAGRMGTVWRATDEVLSRDVAVKVLSSEHAAETAFLTRFEREARLGAQLNSPRIATVLDCGTENGSAYIVMEFVAGLTLRQVLDDVGKVPPEKAIDIAAGVCEALEVAHAAGLVHRDIKPASIVISGGHLKVLDFGIASAYGSADGTPTLGALGTAAYLSPEQASGHPACPQSDLYSLGCVLFEMLTGEPPFAADSAVELAYRHVHDDPGPPSARETEVPAQLDDIIGRLLAKEPADRYESAGAARADLLAALKPPTAGLPSAHNGVIPPQQSRRRRRPTLAELVLAGALAAALAAVAVLLTGTTGHAAPRAAPGVSPSATHHPVSSHPASHPAARKVHRPAHPRPRVQPSVGLRPQRSASPRPRPSASPSPTAHRSASPRPTASPTNPLPAVAAAAGAFVADLDAGVIDGQVAQPAGQDLYKHLQPLLFAPPGQTAQQIEQQYTQLQQSYDQHLQQKQITGDSVTVLRGDLDALAKAVGVT